MAKKPAAVVIAAAAADLVAINTAPSAVSDDLAAVTILSMAVSLQMPPNDNHPNKMPFKGILTRIDEPSDSAPHGSGGRRILVTRAAAEGALSSLLGMAVGLRYDFKGHDPQNKVGLITGAEIVGNAINIEGFIYASDFPNEALNIHRQQARLGFSFEALIAWEVGDGDPAVATKCIFTGAAILLKTDAAYKSTAIAAAAAKETTMEDVTAAVTAAMQALMGPVTEQLTALKASQDAQSAAIEELKKGAPSPHAAVIAKVDPHAARLEAAAAQLEADGISGFHLRRVAAAMRADAAIGMMPRDLHDGAPPPHQQQAPAAAPAFKIEDAPEYKAVVTAAAAQALELKAAQDAIASQGTILKDMKAAADADRTPPQRRTMTPEVLGVLNRMGMEAPGEADTGGIAVHKIDAAMDQMKGSLSTEDRIRFKTILSRNGIVAQ